MNEQQHLTPPKTIPEIGIHLGYIRDDITALTNEIKESNKNYASKAELLAVKKDMKDNYVLKSDFDKLKSRIMPIILTISAVSSAVIIAVALAITNWVLNGGTKQ